MTTRLTTARHNTAMITSSKLSATDCDSKNDKTTMTSPSAGHSG